MTATWTRRNLTHPRHCLLRGCCARLGCAAHRRLTSFVKLRLLAFVVTYYAPSVDILPQMPSSASVNHVCLGGRVPGTPHSSLHHKHPGRIMHSYRIGLSTACRRISAPTNRKQTCSFYWLLLPENITTTIRSQSVGEHI